MDEHTGQLKPFIPSNSKQTLGQRMREVAGQSNFWKAVILVICLMGVKSSFRYFDALYLPYVTRAYEDASRFPYLSLLAMNPIICIATTISGAITILTGRIDPITAMLIGTLLGGIAPFWMAFGPFLISIMMYVLFTTLGEIVWAPVAYSYLMGLTNDGNEGAYSALAGLPAFLAKLLTGGLTGGLMARYCPVHKDEDGQIIPPPPPQLWGSPDHCNGLAIWSIIGATTISSFVFLLLFRRRIGMSPTPGNALVLVDDPETDREGDDVTSSDVEMTLIRDPEPPRTKVVDAMSSLSDAPFPEMDPISLAEGDF